MNLWETRRYALDAHGKQTYGNKPYSYHLDGVVDILGLYGASERVLKIAFLHDVLEDTAITHYDLAIMFNRDIADNVRRLSNVEDIDGTSSLLHTLLNIKGSAECVSVKVADRLFNMRESVINGVYKKKYTKQYLPFKFSLYDGISNASMWAELDKTYSDLIK